MNLKFGGRLRAQRQASRVRLYISNTLFASVKRSILAEIRVLDGFYRFKDVGFFRKIDSAKIQHDQSVGDSSNH